MEDVYGSSGTAKFDAIEGIDKSTNVHLIYPCLDFVNDHVPACETLFFIFSIASALLRIQIET